jgi:curved DNA-binding protein CbpA
MLRKRYKDLVKIFHPDNPGGDARLSSAINRYYNQMKK